MSTCAHSKISLNKYENAESRPRMIAAKKAENKITARVRLHVAERFGQRTCLSSCHAPTKYPPNARNGAAKPRFCLRFAFSFAGSCALFESAGFSATFFALMRSLVSLFNFLLKNPRIIVVSCQVKCTPETTLSSSSLVLRVGRKRKAKGRAMIEPAFDFDRGPKFVCKFSHHV